MHCHTKVSSQCYNVSNKVPQMQFELFLLCKFFYKCFQMITDNSFIQGFLTGYLIPDQCHTGVQIYRDAINVYREGISLGRGTKLTISIAQ